MHARFFFFFLPEFQFRFSDAGAGAAAGSAAVISSMSMRLDKVVDVPVCAGRRVGLCWRCLRLRSSPELVDIPVRTETEGYFEGLAAMLGGHFSRSSGLSRSCAPVFGALDDEEFFVIEGSCTISS